MKNLREQIHKQRHEKETYNLQPGWVGTGDTMMGSCMFQIEKFKTEMIIPG
jgi:hypothetical protein